MKKFILPALLACLALMTTVYAYSKMKGHHNPIICDMQYALCTSAQCIPDPQNPELSICFCEVREGKSLGNSPCDKRLPQTDRFGIRHVVSTFSFEEFTSKENMTCPSGNSWSNCLDQPCIVDPMNPKKAICMCKIVRTGAFQTFGGNCDTSTCETGYWSGATLDANVANVKVLMKAMGLKESPLKICPK